MKEAIDAIVNPFRNHKDDTGLVVGVVQGNQRSIFAYGKVGDQDSRLPREDTLFEIGSVTKVFTAAMLSGMVKDGLLNLDDPVCDLLPELSNLPPEITLVRLATHTSGVPAMPADALRLSRRNRRNPFAKYGISDLLEYLGNYKHKSISSEEIKYSNVGFTILGYVLGKMVGTSYELALVDRICDKLEMQDTRITLSAEQKSCLAEPHAANGKPSQNWDLRGFAGAGGLRSTIGDMLKFVAANLGSPHSSLTEALQACHQVQSEAFPPQSRPRKWASKLIQKGQDAQHNFQAMGLGWVVGRLDPGGPQVHWIHGATGGYRAFTGFVRSTLTGVVVLSNRSLSMVDAFFLDTSTDRIGFRVLEYLNPLDE